MAGTRPHAHRRVALRSLPQAQVEEAGLLLDLYRQSYPAASSFVSASHWADDIKRNHDAYAFSGWHFIDFPYPNREACAKDTVEKQNLVTALEGLRESLANASSPAWSRALLSGSSSISSVTCTSRCILFQGCAAPSIQKGTRGGTCSNYPVHTATFTKLWDAMGGQYADSIAKLCPSREVGMCASGKRSNAKLP